MKHGRNDNLFSSNINKRGSSTTVIAPYVSLEGKNGPHTFSGLFRIERGIFHSSREDDYTDYLLEGRGDIVFSGRAGLGLRAMRQYGHDPRGSTDRAGSATPDEWVNQGLETLFRYGAPGAQGRVEVNAGYFEREYQNNRVNTTASDRTTGIVGGTFYWRVAPKTELLANAQRSKIDYDLSTSTQDSSEDRFYLGAKWDATALTSGTVKVGRLRKHFDNAARTDFSGSSWDVGVTWRPRTYSTLDFITSRQTGESTGVGDTIVTNLYGVTWNHAWNSRFRTTALANRKHDVFFGGGATRIDDTNTFGISLAYQFRRWLRFGAEYTRTDRSSNTPGLDYRRNLWMLTLNATL